MSLQTLKRCLIVAGLVYLLMPRDLIPDFLGRGFGLLDDAAVIGGLTWFYRKKRREFLAREAQEAAAPAAEAPADPYQVLGVPRSASPEAIRAAYRERMREYHPDKVAHLGEELQQVAHRKALEIQRAFEALRGV